MGWPPLRHNVVSRYYDGRLMIHQPPQREYLVILLASLDLAACIGDAAKPHATCWYCSLLHTFATRRLLAIVRLSRTPRLQQSRIVGGTSPYQTNPPKRVRSARGPLAHLAILPERGFSQAHNRSPPGLGSGFWRLCRWSHPAVAEVVFLIWTRSLWMKIF